MRHKTITTLSAFLTCALTTTAYASIEDTHVTLTNNTNHVVNVHSVISTTDQDFKKGSNWDEAPGTLQPYETKQVLWFGRELGLKAGGIYDYDLIVTPTDGSVTAPLVFGFHVTGKQYYGSVLKGSLQMPGNQEQRVTEQHALEHYHGAFWHDDYHIHARRWQPKTNLFSNVHVVIDQDNKQPTHADGDNTLDVLTYNTQLQPFYGRVVNDLNQPAQRAYDIPPMIGHYDVVVFQEVFDEDHLASLTQGMSAMYPFHTRVVGDDNEDAFWSGGVLIFSKWPIEQEKQIVYQTAADSDKYAAKGVIYARINKNGHYYNVFGTHTNAGYEVSDIRARRKQLSELANFVDRLNLRADEPVLIAGDMNIDEFAEEAPTLYQYLNTPSLENKGFKYSSDGFTNTMNVGKVRERLDYVLYDKRHLVPKSAYNRVYVLRAFDDETMWPKFDLSDHYPVESHFEF